jgi:intracellular septation protein
MEPARRISPGLKAALDFGPILLFFAGYFLVRERTFSFGGTEYSGFIFITALFVPVMIAATVALWRLTGRVSPMQIVTLVVVVVFGGLTIWFNDERFFKMKPTIIYALFAAALGFGLLRGRSYLQLVMDEVVPMRPEGWMILTRRLALFFAALAIANEVVWRNFSDGTWVSFKTFGLTALVFAFFLLQGRLFETYGTDKG